MALSYVSSQTGTSSIGSMPSHQAGDLLLFFAYRDGSTTNPTLPSGFTQITAPDGTSCSATVGYKIAAGGSETSGTWTNATSLICHVYRSSTGSVVAGASATTSGTTTTVTYPTVSLNNSSGTSWVAGFAGISTTDTSLETAPSLMTNRSTVNDATDEAAGHDTNGGVTGWSSTNVSAGGTNGNWVSAVVEIAESPVVYISSSTGTNSIGSMPTHQSGDLLLFFAYRDGSLTAPSLPSGYTSVLTKSDASGADNSCRVGWKIATSGSETSGTWTNATSLLCHVYRGTDQTAPIGGTSTWSYGEAGTASIDYRTITMSVTNNTSWVVGFAGHRATDTSLQTPPTGMVNRTTVADATDEAAGHDTNRGVASWSTQTVSVGGTTNGWCSIVVEILAGSATQTLTPSLFTNSNTFYTPTVSASYALTPSLFTNSGTFYTPTLAASYALTTSLFTNSATFYQPTVTPGSIALTPDLFSNAAAFYSPAVAPVTITLTPDSLDSGIVFYSLTASASYALTPSLFDNQPAFYDLAVTPVTITLTPELLTNSSAFYDPPVTASYTLTADKFNNPQEFYTHSSTGGGLTLEPELFENQGVIYQHEAAPGTVTLLAGLFENANVFDAPAVSTNYLLTADVFGNVAEFYEHTASPGAATLLPDLYESQQEFYAPALDVGAAPLFADKFNNQNVIYSHALSKSYSIDPALFENAPDFYTPSLSVGSVTLTPALFTNSATFYQPEVSGEIQPDRFDNQTTFYSPSAAASNTLTPAIFNNQITFYTNYVAGLQTIVPDLFSNQTTFYAEYLTSIGIPDNVNLQMLYDDILPDYATLTATSSAAGFGVTNLLENNKSTVWRSTSLSSQTITATWSAAQAISGIGFAFTNLIEGSTIRIRLYTQTTDPAPVYDSTATSLLFAYEFPAGLSTLGLLSFAFGGGTYFSAFFDEYNVKKMVIDLDSAGNADGYMEVAKIMTGRKWAPTYNAEYGAQVTPVDLSQVSRTIGGDQKVDVRTMHKKMDFNLRYMPQSDKTALSTIVRKIGMRQPVFVSMYPNETDEVFQAGNIFGRFESLSPFAHSLTNVYDTSITIEEI